MSTKRDIKSRRVSRQPSDKHDLNYLPDSVAQSFELELDHLVEELSGSNGFKGRYLKSEYKSKYRDPKGTSPEVRREAAIAKWLATEQRNCATNQRVQLGDADFGWATSDDVLAKAKSFITQVLGPLRYPDVLNLGSGHTNGASTRVRRGPEAAIVKHTGVAHVSSSAVKHWLQFAKNSVLSDQCMQIQETSVLFTVPKSSDIDRVACKEPEVNMLLQRSIGTHIRRKLRRVGLNLNDQRVNQRLASEALRRQLATIDLSSASDSISNQLVFELLPFDWWELLDDLRVHYTEIDGDIHELNMFSSMGNGFTFELESLIFWALARSIMYFSGIRGRLSVYGDDIICPKAVAPRLARVFGWFGFKVNTKKSHWSGSFRESCGGHYYRGYDVTPFYVREPVRRKTDVIRLLNQLMYWDARGVGFISDTSILAFHCKWSRVIPRVIWGGVDPMDPSALVTGNKPRKRLVQRSRSRSVPECARLHCWLTKRETLEAPLSLDVRQEVEYRYQPQAPWTVRTTWDPWYMDPPSVD